MCLRSTPADSLGCGPARSPPQAGWLHATKIDGDKGTHPAATTFPAMPQLTTSADFWRLMARWNISNASALSLIDHAPSPTSDHPRFALTTDQAERLAMLAEIESLGTSLYGDVGQWLRRPNRAKVFKGRAPAELMAREGRKAIHDVLVYLQKTAMTTALARR